MTNLRPILAGMAGAALLLALFHMFPKLNPIPSLPVLGK